MNETLIRKAAVARKRMRPTAKVQVSSVRGAFALGAAAQARMVTRVVRPNLTRDDLLALAAAARKQLHRG